jgi:hypothetical protein
VKERRRDVERAKEGTGYTDKKENKIFFIYKKSDGIECKVIYEREGFLIMRNAQIFSPYIRRSLVIYEFVPEPSEFPNI